MDNGEALAQIAGGTLNSRRMVALEETPPPADEPSDESDQVAIVQYWPEAVRIDGQTAAAGMLVLSDDMYPGWHARLDDVPAKVYVADGGLRAAAIPPGQHTVEFQHSSRALPARRRGWGALGAQSWRADQPSYTLTAPARFD